MTKRKQHKKGKRAYQSDSASEHLFLLDQFSSSDLTNWKRIGTGIDKYNYRLYFALESQRAENQDKLVSALRESGGNSIELEKWVRTIDYGYSDQPLSSAGSLTGVGGRFNIGRDVGPIRFSPFPALYLASTEATSHNEKFGSSKENNLESHELALAPKKSYATVFVRGKIDHLFDLRSANSLTLFTEVIKQFEIPKEVSIIAIELRFPPSKAIKTTKELLNSLMAENWRYYPTQHGIPANSQIFATFLIAAGFEGVIYKSQKGLGDCIALFPELFEASSSYIELTDTAPKNTIQKLSSETYKILSGK